VSMDNQVVTTVDLQYFERFDSTTSAMQIKIGTRQISLIGPFEAGRKYALYLNSPGSIIVLQEDPLGVELKQQGRNAKTLYVSKLLQILKERGVMIPQTADFQKQEQPTGQHPLYIGRLKTLDKQDENSPSRKYGPRKGGALK